ncbi:unnamed protein product [Clavelina lepadiformis]|uniref:Multivesicular body subunit 12B n=1 Tax=Clavelina lepadiformis TaxID=159417 RepID=A0ABP0F265_CLALP
MNQAAFPITNICVVSDKKNCPPRYTILDRTVCSGDDADFWKDKLFKNKVLRYICYTKDLSSNQIPQVVTDIALVSLKDPTPQGYTAINLTADTHEQALRKHILCVRFILKNMTNSAITDIALYKDNSYKERQYTLVGEVNGINFTFLLGPVAVAAQRPAPAVPVAREQLVNAPTSPPPVQPRHVQTYENLQPKTSSKQPLTGIEGIPFKLNDRLTKNIQGNLDKSALDLQITIRSLSELEELTEYNFSREKTLINVP